jgi:hypothetical protein
MTPDLTPDFARSRSMFRSLAVLLLAIGALTAHAQSNIYSVEIRPTLNDLDIKVEHVAQASTLVVNLTNNSPTRVRCNLRFDPSPQTPVRRTRHIDPGRTDSTVLRAKRRWFSVTVDVECVPAPR